MTTKELVIWLHEQGNMASGLSMPTTAKRLREAADRLSSLDSALRGISAAVDVARASDPRKENDTATTEVLI